MPFVNTRTGRGVVAVLPLLAVSAYGQTCTGLCLQQISCAGGATTTITGTIYAPNGVDPLPGIIVYIPNGTVDAFTPGVSCAVTGEAPSGQPLVGTTTATNGTFTLSNVPVGSNIPLVIQSGRWRRQVTVPAVAACTNTAFSTRFARTQAEGDIPHIAVVTGSADAVECVLRKVGLADSEFTDASGTGRVNLFQATGSPGAKVDTQTPTADTVLANQTTLNSYDVLMLPCEGSAYTKSSGELGNLISYANAGGRVYASHFSYDWFVGNGDFNNVVNWNSSNLTLPDGTATVNTSFAQGALLSDWLGVVGASTTTPAQIGISTLRQNFSTVNAPTQAWLTLNNSAYGNPIMQFTFDAPVGATTNACGRVLFNEYHVEDTSSSGKLTFPNECSSGTMTAQEKLLEFNLFDLTGDGTPPTLLPTSGDLGSEPVGLTTTSQKFLWTNNTYFPATVTGAVASGDFAVTRNTCAVVAVGSSCEIDADFTPTALGTRTGTLSVTANTGTLTAALTGNGVNPLVISASGLAFGSVDVGASVSRTLVLTNTTGSPLLLAAPGSSGDFAVASTCANALPAQGSCVLNITFTPSTTGTRSGTLNLALANIAGFVVNASLSGDGVDFTEAVGPASAQTIAGLSTSTTGLTTPIAGFANPVSITCTTTAPASTCVLATSSFSLTTPTADTVTITTTAQYSIVGYGGLGLDTLGCCFVLTSTLLLRRRRLTGAALPGFLLAAASATVFIASLSGCSGKEPAANTPYTPAGTYSYNVTATDGFLKHSATYTLIVTAK